MTASEKSIYHEPVFSGLKVARVCPLHPNTSVILCLIDTRERSSIGIGLNTRGFDDSAASREFFDAAVNKSPLLVGYEFNISTGKNFKLQGEEAVPLDLSCTVQPHDLSSRYWLFGANDLEVCAPGFSLFKGSASYYSDAERKTDMFHYVQIIDRHTGMEYVRSGSFFLRKVLGSFPSPFHLLTRKA